MSPPTVSVQRTTPKTVLADYALVMRNAGYARHLSPSRRTIVKLNLSWSVYFPACSTAPWQLEGVLRTLRADGYTDLVAAEHRTVVTDLGAGVANNRWGPVLSRYSVPFIPLTETPWVPCAIKAETPALDAIFGDTHTIPGFFPGCDILHLPTMKTHGHTVMTGVMKNAFGGLVTERRHHCHRMIHDVLVDLLKIQKEIHPGMFAVVDGTVCGNGHGPRTMIPHTGNLLLAGQDPVAVDAVSARIMGFDPMQIPFIQKAHDLGLGCGDCGQIDIAGEDIGDLNFRFHTGKSPVIAADQLFRNGRLRFLERLLFHTALFSVPVFASAFYHDVLWYNTVGRMRIARFGGTPWGSLFAAY
jgi:uncharacterized protein (DUF362 family)